MGQVEAVGEREHPENNEKVLNYTCMKNRALKIKEIKKADIASEVVCEILNLSNKL